MTNTMVWLAAMIVLIIIEIVTVGLTTIWFAIGALFAIIVSMLDGGIILQMTVFLLVSLGMLIFTRPLAIRYINNTRTRTNYEGIIGKVVRITQEVDNIAGQNRRRTTAEKDGLYHIFCIVFRFPCNLSQQRIHIFLLPLSCRWSREEITINTLLNTKRNMNIHTN